MAKPTLEQVIKRINSSCGSVSVGWFDARNAEVAIYMEYGTDTVPARPSLGPAIAAHKKTITKMSAKLIEKAERGFNPDALEVIGEYGAEAVKNYILSHNIPPPLAQKTIDAKGHDHALIDTEELINGVEYKVNKSSKRD